MGSPMGRLARAVRTSRQLKTANMHLQQSVADLTRSNTHLQQKITALEVQAKKLIGLQRECEALKVSLKHSEEVRKQQKELIQILQTNHTNQRTASANNTTNKPKTRKSPVTTSGTLRHKYLF